MRLYIAADHAGFAIKEAVKEFLVDKGYDVEDCGAYSLNIHDDYPDFIAKAAEKISQFPEDRAILLAGSGQAEMMLANKYPHVRAALFYAPKVATKAVDMKGTKSEDPYEMLRLTRVHNDANVLSLGVRFLTDEEVFTAIRVWLITDFLKEERHVRRLKKIEEIEKSLHE